MSDSVAVLEQRPTPYRPALLNEIGKHRDVTVFYFETTDPKNRWDDHTAGGGANFTERNMVSFDIGPFTICPTLPFRILDGEFDEVVGTSDTTHMPTMMLLLPIFVFTDISLTVWTEEIDTDYRYDHRKNKSKLMDLLATIYWTVTQFCQRVVYATADRVIAYSEIARDTAIARGASESKIITRPQAIDRSVLSEPSSECNPPEGNLTVLFLGTVGKRKGIDVLTDALDYLPSSTKLWIAGEGPEIDSIEALAASEDRMEVFGRVDEATKVALLQKADVVALPSRHEPWGIVTLEALYCDTPVVTTSAAGAAMIFDDEFVVSPGDAKQLGEALLNAATAEAPDPPELETMAEPLYTRQTSGT